MSLTEVEKNLLVFLDPTFSLDADRWIFVTTGISKCTAETRSDETGKSQNIVYRFPRKNLLSYLFWSLVVRFKYRKERVRRVLYINDWILSSFFHANRVDGYRAFTKRHIHLITGRLRWFLSLLSPVWRAEQRFIVIGNADLAVSESIEPEITSLDFMFFSNAAGKLIFTKSETFLTGSGQLFKTTAIPEYAKKLQIESAAVNRVRQFLRKPELVPSLQRQFKANDRCFFIENYLCGENLRWVLLDFGRHNAFKGAASVLERLDSWYAEYKSGFTSEKVPFSQFYGATLDSFTACHSDKPDFQSLSTGAERLIAILDDEYKGLITVTAHNDLWPENFILNGDQLIAIDWERATENSSPLFDYYWMMISAVLEYRVGRNGIQDYVVSLRQFFERTDEVCCLAHRKLENFIVSLGFDKELYPQLMMLFLMELSVQGYRTFGKSTDNDRMALGELLNLHRDNPEYAFYNEYEIDNKFYGSLHATT